VIHESALLVLRLIGTFPALAAAGFACVVAAQEYPSRPIRLVVPFAAGGTATINARVVADQVAQQIGQPIVLDNRPGANGMIGIQIVAQAPPDGHTMLYTTTSIAINPSFYRNLPYDLARDLRPVTVVAAGIGNVLLAHTAFPPRTVKELIASAKQKPVNYSSAGIGNSTHLMMEMFAAAAGVKMTHVPYKGVAPAMAAVIGGEVHVMFIPPTAAVPHIKAGRVRVLGFSGKNRWDVLPDVPTIAEAALPGWHKDSGFNVWLAPARTPSKIAHALQREIHKALQVTKVREVFVNGAYETLGNTPPEAIVFLRQQVKFYADISRRIGIVPE
jgi:tripartite-type tricarboxylate transporter receptor subunit TctC